MEIINNKIKLSQGETAEYDCDVIIREGNVGIPYRIYGNSQDYWIKFTVVPDVYSKEITFSKDLVLENVIKFTSSDIETITTTTQPANVRENVLYKYAQGSVPKYFVKPTGGQWQEYKFNINFRFAYQDTKNLVAKTYKYDIVLMGGNHTSTSITFLDPLIKYEDFTVEAGTHE